MRLLFPELTLMQALALLTAFVVCLVFGGEPSPGIVYALPPLVAGLLAAGAVAASAAPKIIEGIQKKRALKRIEESPEAKAMARLEKKARKRLRKGEYGMSEAQKRQMVGEAARSYEAGTKSLESEVKRAGAASPLGGGAARANIEAIREGMEGTTAKARAAGETISQQKAATDRAADLGMASGGLARRTAMEQGRAAAGTAIGTGIAQGVGTGISAGTQMYSAGVFNPNLSTQAGVIGSQMQPGSAPVTGPQTVAPAQ
jgi:hypothetical protein